MMAPQAGSRVSPLEFQLLGIARRLGFPPRSHLWPFPISHSLGWSCSILKAIKTSLNLIQNQTKSHWLNLRRMTRSEAQEKKMILPKQCWMIWRQEQSGGWKGYSNPVQDNRDVNHHFNNFSIYNISLSQNFCLSISIMDEVSTTPRVVSVS